MDDSEGHILQHDELVQEVKKVKSDDKEGREESSEVSEPENILSAVTATKVLKDSAREKSVFIHGRVRPPPSLQNPACSPCRITSHTITLSTAGRPGGCGHHGVDPHQGGHAGGAIR